MFGGAKEFLFEEAETWRMNRSLPSEAGGKYKLGQGLACAKTQSRNNFTRAKELGRSQGNFLWSRLALA